jgi:hypothetical protein
MISDKTGIAGDVIYGRLPIAFLVNPIIVLIPEFDCILIKRIKGTFIGKIPLKKR